MHTDYIIDFLVVDKTVISVNVTNFFLCISYVEGDLVKRFLFVKYCQKNHGVLSY